MASCVALWGLRHQHSPCIYNWAVCSQSPAAMLQPTCLLMRIQCNLAALLQVSCALDILPVPLFTVHCNYIPPRYDCMSLAQQSRTFERFSSTHLDHGLQTEKKISEATHSLGNPCPTQQHPGLLDPSLGIPPPLLNQPCSKELHSCRRPTTDLPLHTDPKGYPNIPNLVAF